MFKIKIPYQVYKYINGLTFLFFFIYLELINKSGIIRIIEGSKTHVCSHIQKYITIDEKLKTITGKKVILKFLFLF